MADTSQVREITARLEQGVKDLFSSDTYADYLKTMSRFYQYSTRNTLLIHMQMPGASHVAGFQAWQNKFGRHVVKGAKSIKILAPTPLTIREEKEKLDPDTRLPVLDENGMPVVEETQKQIARFKVVSVFDISQTDGKPLPSLVQDLTGNVEQYAAFMDALKAVSPLPIVFEPLPSDTDGICTFGDKISIRKGMSEIQSVSAVIHEITHAKLHDLVITVENAENSKPKDRRTEEVEAESVSYAVCQYFGIETGANSFGYLAEWSKGRELKELNASLDTIRKTAAELIDAIDGKFREIAKERDITFAVGEEQEALSEPTVFDPSPTKEEILAQMVFSHLKSGDMVYLDQAINPVQLVSVRKGEVLFVVPELAVELTRTHEQVIQSLRDHPKNRHLLDAADIDRPTPGTVYARYCNQVSDIVGQDQAYVNAFMNSDEQNTRIECVNAVKRAVMVLFSQSEQHVELYRQYEENPDFKARLEDYVFMRNYLEPKSAQRDAPEPADNQQTPVSAPEVPAPVSAALPVYFTVPPETRSVGANVLMTPVFDGSNFNRSGKKIRVAVEKPIGKYAIYSREENDDKNLYFLTASGRIDRTAGYFSSVWDEQQNKRVDYRPTEAELDDAMAQAAERFEQDMADPAKWAKYQHAAVLNRLDECEKHNAPVRIRRDEEAKRGREEQAQQDAQERLQKQEKYDARVDEIAAAIHKGSTISVSYDEDAFDGRNPVLDLFRLYGVDLPLRTQGWVNTGLAEISENGYRYYSSKHKRNSTTFSEYFAKLREAIKAMPIEQKRAELNPAKPAPATDADKFLEDIGGIGNLFGKPTPPPKERRNTLEFQLYEKFEKLFPQIASGEYRYLRLEADAGMEPLSLEWIGNNMISVMHTYKQNGDTCYDPMIVYEVGYGENDVRTLIPVEFEQSIPPLYQVKDSDGRWRSVDGNGNEKTVWGLQKSLNEFSVQWFGNIAQQGYMPVKATMVIDGEKTLITFDKDGNTIMPEPERDSAVSTIANDKELAEKIERQLLEDYEATGASGVDGVPGAYIGPDQELAIMRLNHWRSGGIGRELFMENERKQYANIEQPAEPPESFEVTVFTHEDGGYDTLAGEFDIRQDAEAYARLLDDGGFYGVSLRAVVDGEEHTLTISISLEDAQNNKQAADRFSKFKESLDAPAEPSVPPISTKQVDSVNKVSKVTTLDLSLPDPLKTAAERDAYGYTQDDMFPLSRERAVELFDADHTIYLLYPDNTEAMAFDRDEIIAFDGLCGIEQADWAVSPILAAQKAVVVSIEASRETDLLYGETGRFGIYQVRSGDELRDYRFEPLDRLQSRGLNVDRKNYELVYVAPLDIRDTNTNLNKIYDTFNVAHPEDYTGRSVSVSDVIVLQWRGNISSHYVDDFGFTELPAFLGEETQKAQTAETPAQSYSQLGNSSQPTVAELEADAKAGKIISITDLSKALNAERSKPPIGKGRPTLMARLEANKQKAARQGQPDAHKTKERDV